MSLCNVPQLQELYFHPWKLPSETSTLVDDQFYSFIEYMAGSTLSNLLRVQEINSDPILLLTADVFEYLFLKINDPQTDLLRQDTLLQMDNNTSVVKSANRTKINCLLGILKIASDRINYSLFTTPSATPAIPTTNTSINAMSSGEDSRLLRVNDERSHLLKCIDDWSSLNDTLLNLKNFKLKEGSNFKLNVKTGTNGIQASIECQCKSIITLGKHQNRLIPSNFYRHLKSPGCKHINRLLKEQESEETNRNNSYSTSTSSSS
ncbi:hypothetical protein I4U23_005687 [Adineta vaga]|nr:hypothetical protein I4U23_005687 [Adineta vaga]